MKTAIITGAGSDIGQAVIHSLIDNKWQIIAIDHGIYYEKIKSEATKYLKIIDIDFNNDLKINEIKLMLYEIDAQLVVNIAGINIMNNFLDIEENALDMMLNINLKNTVIFSQQIAKHMVERNIEGNFIFISSQHGNVVNYDRVPYIITKAAISAFSKALALELAIYNIRSNSISPTFVKTTSNEKLLETPFFKLNALDRIALGRYAVPKDIANAVVFLSDSTNSMITGIDLAIDGGWCIQGGN